MRKNSESFSSCLCFADPRDADGPGGLSGVPGAATPVRSPRRYGCFCRRFRHPTRSRPRPGSRPDGCGNDKVSATIRPATHPRLTTPFTSPAHQPHPPRSRIRLHLLRYLRSGVTGISTPKSVAPYRNRCSVTDGEGARRRLVRRQRFGPARAVGAIGTAEWDRRRRRHTARPRLSSRQLGRNPIVAATTSETPEQHCPSWHPRSPRTTRPARDGIWPAGVVPGWKTLSGLHRTRLPLQAR
jgi:hypothetical protein